jgi:hypothetical protein
VVISLRVAVWAALWPLPLLVIGYFVLPHGWLVIASFLLLAYWAGLAYLAGIVLAGKLRSLSRGPLVIKIVHRDDERQERLQ